MQNSHSGPKISIWTLETIKSRMQAGTRIPSSEGERVRAVDIGDNLIIKFGRWIAPEEGLATQFVARHTQGIPVATIHAIVRDEASNPPYTYIVQERLPGKRLIELLPMLDAATCYTIALELKAILSELAKLNTLGCMGTFGFPGQYPYTSLDQFIEGYPPYRITSPHDFVRWLPDAVRSVDPESPPLPSNIFDAFDTSRPPIFCHGDLVPENILVFDGHISGVIDWGCAGWYPYFWNDWIACWRQKMPQYRDGKWIEMVNVMTEPFPAEVAAFEKIFRKASETL
ncbi:kinase-like domain-containing protein [Favolaschia claudopus]|uniref:Kinase-like domain-containing protein n=1 Tax=Favolaschia claudopus TaxID=2862362 RepID=A0AAW0DK76_9AGAR